MHIALPERVLQAEGHSAAEIKFQDPRDRIAPKVLGVCLGVEVLPHMVSTKRLGNKRMVMLSGPPSAAI